MTLNWYALYTKHNAEQTVQECILSFSQSNSLNYETYLPIRKEVKKWGDRMKVVQVPLFKNYLFVKHDDNAFHHIIKMKGVCDYIRFGPKPSKIPKEQMEMIKKVIQLQSSQLAPSNKFVKGKKVEITKGPLAGYSGILLEDQKNNNLSVEIKSLKLFFDVKVPVNDF